MSSESIATVESEFVPPAKRPERVLVTHTPDRSWIAHCNDIDWRFAAAQKNGWHAFVLRVQPPVERRVEIEQAARDIIAKCEQYWGEHNINDAEIHAALDVIHRAATRIVEVPE